LIYLSSDNCQVLEYDSSKLQCLAIRSQMQVHFRGEDTDALDVEEFLKNLFQQRMESNPNSLRAGYIDQLAYVGDRDSIPTASADSSQAQNSMNNNQVLSLRGGALVPTLISVSTVVLLGGLFFLFRAKHRWNNQQDHDAETKDEVIGVPDLETGSTGTSEASAGSQPPSSTEDQLLQNTDSSEEPSTMDRPPLSTRRSDPGLSLVDIGIPFVTSQDSTDGVVSTSAVVAGGVAPDALPPRHPRRNSTKLKKCRKRRKKKKKVTLKRVNSRENVAQMDAIAETGEEEEEGSEYTYESGSEYSTEDDGSSNPSSGCLTPIRVPNSRTSSRHSSPRLSPRDELFPDDVFSTDFEFLIEAPDFPYHSKDKKTKTLQPRNISTPRNNNNHGGKDSTASATVGVED
jgi:hypothetical protein